MHPIHRWFVQSALVLALTPTAFAGPVWDENNSGDAGSLPGSAQTTTGVGQIQQIRGSLGHILLGGPVDLEDMFLINITDPALFTATTTFIGLLGASEFDTQLWLFDALGFGVLGNNDDPGGGFGSRLEAPGLAAGLYYIAISGIGNNPVSPGGEMFFFGSTTEISGPDGPGGTEAISGWTGGGTTELGDYVIHLTGAEFAAVPAPGGLALLGLALLRSPRRRRA